MNPFRSYTYTWWQMGIFKFALLAIGIILGAYLSAFVLSAVWVFITIAVVASAYIVAISFSGKNPVS
jgi:hypothetical protein